MSWLVKSSRALSDSELSFKGGMSKQPGSLGNITSAKLPTSLDVFRSTSDRGEIVSDIAFSMERAVKGLREQLRNSTWPSVWSRR